MGDRSPVKNRLIISFSGIDGAGKSTQITRLSEALEANDCRVAIITFWDDVVALKRFREEAGHKVFKGDRGIGSPEAPISRRDKNVQSPVLTLIRMVLYFIDAISLRKVLRKFQREQQRDAADVIIFDRYLYDELANIKADNVLTRLYLRTLLRMTPKPEAAFVLDVVPEVAFARKPEYPLEFLHSNRNAYLDLARRSAMIVIPPSTIDQAHTEILGTVLRKRDALSPMNQQTGQSLKAI